MDVFGTMFHACCVEAAAVLPPEKAGNASVVESLCAQLTSGAIYNHDVTGVLDFEQIAPVVPAWWINGLLFVIVLVTTVLLSFLSIHIFLDSSMRSPTNVLLTAITALDLLTCLFQAPIHVHVYLLESYKELPSITWCSIYFYVYNFLPPSFHGTAFLLSMYLSVQRYAGVKDVRGCHAVGTYRGTIIAIIACLLISFAVHSMYPAMVAVEEVTAISKKVLSSEGIYYIQSCRMVDRLEYHANRWFATYMWLRVMVLQVPPALVLSVCNIALIRASYKTHIYRKRLVGAVGTIAESGPGLTTDMSSVATVSEMVSLSEGSRRLSSEVVSLSERSRRRSSEVVSLSKESMRRSSEVVSLSKGSRRRSSEVVSLSKKSRRRSSEVVSMSERSRRLSSEVVSMSERSRRLSSKVMSLSKESSRRGSEVVSLSKGSKRRSSEVVSMSERSRRRSSAMVNLSGGSRRRCSELIGQRHFTCAERATTCEDSNIDETKATNESAKSNKWSLKTNGKVTPISPWTTLGAVLAERLPSHDRREESDRVVLLEARQSTTKLSRDAHNFTNGSHQTSSHPGVHRTGNGNVENSGDPMMAREIRVAAQQTVMGNTFESNSYDHTTCIVAGDISRDTQRISITSSHFELENYTQIDDVSLFDVIPQQIAITGTTSDIGRSGSFLEESITSGAVNRSAQNGGSYPDTAGKLNMGNHVSSSNNLKSDGINSRGQQSPKLTTQRSGSRGQQFQKLTTQRNRAEMRSTIMLLLVTSCTLVFEIFVIVVLLLKFMKAIAPYDGHFMSYADLVSLMMACNMMMVLNFPLNFIFFYGLSQAFRSLLKVRINALLRKIKLAR